MNFPYIEGWARLGPRYAGLTGTIGYRLEAQDGTLARSFTTAGVAETSIPGDYAVTTAGVRGLPLPAAGWSGRAIWGTSTADLVEEEIGPPPWYTAPAATLALDLTQAVPNSNAPQTVGDCLNAARAQGFGRWVLDDTAIPPTLTLYAADATTPVRVFTLDAAVAARSRT